MHLHACVHACRCIYLCTCFHVYIRVESGPPFPTTQKICNKRTFSGCTSNNNFLSFAKHPQYYVKYVSNVQTGGQIK